jgi:hypothetical protein
MDTATAEALKAIAVVVGAVAWPIVAGVSIFVFRPQLRNLLNRLREDGGAKFDPAPQGQEVSATLISCRSGCGWVYAVGWWLRGTAYSVFAPCETGLPRDRSVSAVFPRLAGNESRRFHGGAVACR